MYFLKSYSSNMFVSEKVLPNVTTLAQSLRTKQVDNAVLDINLAEYRGELFNDSWCKIIKQISYPFTLGISLSGDVIKLERHFRQYMKMNNIRVARTIEVRWNVFSPQINHDFVKSMQIL